MNLLKIELVMRIIEKLWPKKQDEHEIIEQPILGTLESRLIEDEGLVLTPYKDTVGNLTIGVGHNLSRGISKEAAMFIFREDLKQAIVEAESLSFYSGLDDNRKEVIVNMIFNLGLPRFLRFKKMIAAIEKKNYQEASKQMLQSKWAKQVSNRAIRLSKTMKGE